jgi:hypothetical protein
MVAARRTVVVEFCNTLNIGSLPIDALGTSNGAHAAIMRKLALGDPRRAGWGAELTSDLAHQRRRTMIGPVSLIARETA